MWLTVVVSLAGFLLQFIGSRALHSSVSVIQLGVTLVMSGIRASLRFRRLHKHDNLMDDDPDVDKGYELDWLATMVAGNYHRFLVISRAFDSDTKDTIERLVESGHYIVKKHPASQSSGEVPVMWGVMQDLRHQEQNHAGSSATALHAPENWRLSMEQKCELMADLRKRFRYRARLAQLTGIDPSIESAQGSSI